MKGQNMEALDLFRTMISLDQDIELRAYNPEGKVEKGSDNDILLSLSGCKDYLLDYVKTQHAPLVLSTRNGVFWFAGFRQNTPPYIYVLGPVRNNGFAPTLLKDEKRNQKFFESDEEQRQYLRKRFKRMPIIGLSEFLRMGLMLVYCLTGETIAREEVYFMREDVNEDTAASTRQNSYDSWKSQRALLDDLKHGNLDYQENYKKAVNTGQGIYIPHKNPVDKAIISGIVFTSLCAETAVAGGLSPEAAYGIGNRYIRELDRCKNITEVVAIDEEMYDRFVHQVHDMTVQRATSECVRTCIDYIHENIDHTVTLAELAERVGYSESYVSRKFTAEMHVTISDYIAEIKLSRAKELLQDPTLSISEIAEQLHYSSASYFSAAFKKKIGVAPENWRSADCKK